MNKEKEKLAAYLDDLSTITDVIVEGITMLQNVISNDQLDDETCKRIRSTLSEKTSKNNLSEVNIAFIKIFKNVMSHVD